MPAFRKKTIAFYNGEITKKDYKGFSGLYGSYAQKDGKKGMLRLRMTAGRITKEKLAFTAVSYTHLDVYKRQILICSPWSFGILSVPLFQKVSDTISLYKSYYRQNFMSS